MSTTVKIALDLRKEHPGFQSSHASFKRSLTSIPNPEPRIPNPEKNAFTLVELIAAMTILLLLTSLALPVARTQAQRARETELRRDLRQMREAIDRYKDFADRGMIPVQANTFGYPPDLAALVKGVVLKGTATGHYKFLRRIPVDPLTGKPDWGLRSMQDDPDSRSWEGSNVFDVYSQSQGTALDGSRYADW